MSTATIATILLLGVFLVLVFLRVPVVYAIGVASLLDFFYLNINPMQMALKFVSNLNSYTLLAVPFFILMGELMSAGGITDTLIAFSKELVGWMRGGAAMVNVVASFFFGGISGSSSADCASLGPIEIKMMEEQGYDREFSTCLTTFNIYPSLVKWGGAGALVPITGFANSVAAPAIEFQKEGQVFGIGCKIFTIAGPVILYGIFVSWVLGLIGWIGSLL